MGLPNRVVVPVGFAAAVWLTLYQRGRSAGSTASERRRFLLGDELVYEPNIVTDHAVSIASSPEDVWAWLVQMGWHRGGWYTYRWVDRLLFPQNLPSADTILAEYQDLHEGDKIPDGAPETNCYFVVKTLEPDRLLVLYSTSHLPPGLAGKWGVELSWTWTFSLQPDDSGFTRLHFRSRIALKPWWLRWAYRLLLVPADYLMAGSMCSGIKQRAEDTKKRRLVRDAAQF